MEYTHKIRTDYGVELEFAANAVVWPQVVYIDGNEFDADDDTLYGLFVLHEGNFKRITNFYSEAEDAFREQFEEEQAEESMRQELSSLEMTGRV